MFKNKSKKMIYRIVLLVLMDALIITLSGPLAIYIRYNLFFESRAIEFIENIFRYLPVNLIITLGAFYSFRLYQGIWRYASASDLVNILLACLVSAVTQAAGMWLMRLDYPRSYPFMYFFILAFGISVFRFMYRILGYIQQKRESLSHTGKSCRTAGSASSMSAAWWTMIRGSRASICGGCRWKAPGTISAGWRKSTV